MSTRSSRIGDLPVSPLAPAVAGVIDSAEALLERLWALNIHRHRERRALHKPLLLLLGGARLVTIHEDHRVGGLTRGPWPGRPEDKPPIA